jgi:hypothetical protein
MFEFEVDGRDGVKIDCCVLLWLAALHYQAKILLLDRQKRRILSLAGPLLNFSRVFENLWEPRSRFRALCPVLLLPRMVGGQRR